MSLRRVNPRRDRAERLRRAEFHARGAVTWQLSSPGLPDLLVAYRGRWGLVEIKSARGKLEPLQQLFHTAAQAQQLPCFVVRTADDVAAALEQLGKLA